MTGRGGRSSISAAWSPALALKVACAQFPVVAGLRNFTNTHAASQLKGGFTVSRHEFSQVRIHSTNIVCAAVFYPLFLEDNTGMLLL